MKIMKIFP